MSVQLVDLSLHHRSYFPTSLHTWGFFIWCQALLGIGYFWTPISIVDLFSGTWLNSLKTAWCFWVMLLWFLRGTWSGTPSRVNYSQLLRWNLPVYSTQCSVNYEFFISILGMGTIFSSVWPQRIVASNPLWWFFFRPWVISSYECSLWYSAVCFIELYIFSLSTFLLSSILPCEI